MTDELLESARDRLVAASEDTSEDEVADRIGSVAEKLATWTEMDEGPDHGQLARIENRLHGLAGDAGEDVIEDIEAAHELLKEYRSGVEGV